ncbi:glycoside hydrolase family 93 protein [Xylogone sp. PMI_703]|nr:glycoside hydrolase family 93 protein [Xylogone sp. PMI_703]
MILKLYFLSLLSTVCFGSSASNGHKGPKPWSLFNQNVIYQPPTGQNVEYPRYVELQDGTLLATTTLSGFNPQFFPVFQSKDGGASWKWISNITDQVNGWGLQAQPALAELTEPLGGFPKGTILASGNSENRSANGGTHIDLYASKDKARSWEFVSHIAMGGPPNTTNGATPIWEPYLMLYDHQLVAYYSDQRDPLHGQKLAHQTTRDLRHWGPTVNDVAYANYTVRPGMTIVTYIPPVKKWILVHEFPGGLSLGNAEYPVHYRMADSPLEFDSGEANPIVPRGNITQQPSSSPYVVWTPVGGEYGTIIVSDADHSSLFYNQRGGDVNAWFKVNCPQPMAYSRAIHIFNKYPDHLMILGAANFPGVDPPGTIRPLSLSVVSVTDLVAGKYAAGGPDSDD